MNDKIKIAGTYLVCVKCGKLDPINKLPVDTEIPKVYFCDDCANKLDNFYEPVIRINDMGELI